jgi:uncharacterized protein (DUF2235 family)
MINTVGLLPAHNEEHIPFAFECYKKSTTPKGTQMSADFLKTFSEKIKIHFVGLWCELFFYLSDSQLTLSKGTLSIPLVPCGRVSYRGQMIILRASTSVTRCR